MDVKTPPCRKIWSSRKQKKRGGVVKRKSTDKTSADPALVRAKRGAQPAHDSQKAGGDKQS